jgi:hypothetical protein
MSKSTIIVSAACVLSAAALYAAGCVGVSRADTVTPDVPATQSYTAPDAATQVVTRDGATAGCAEGTVMAEDGSCVDPHYWDGMPGTLDNPWPVSPTNGKPVTGGPEPVTPVTAPTFPDLVLPACPTEDSENCYWDATVRGNHRGESFINWNGVYYYAR